MSERRGLAIWARALALALALGCGKLNAVVGRVTAAGGRASTPTDASELAGQAGDDASHGGVGEVANAGGVGGSGATTADAGMGGAPDRCPDSKPTFCRSSGECTDLTSNPDYCGTCTTKCRPLAGCDQGNCSLEPLDILTVPGCSQLALQRGSDGLYVLSLGTHSLTRIGIPLGDRVEITQALSQPTAFTLGGGFAYVVTGNGITRVNLASGATALVTQLNTPIADVAYAGGTLYYAADELLRSIDASVEGGAGTIRTASGGGLTHGVAVSGDYAVFASMNTFDVASLKLDGGQQSTQLAAGQDSLLLGHRSVQVDQGFAFWANGTVQFTKKEGGVPAKSAGPARGIVTAFAADGTDVAASEWTYFMSSTGDLEKATLGSDQAHWMARGLGIASSVVVDDENVYVATKACHVWQTLSAP